MREPTRRMSGSVCTGMVLTLAVAGMAACSGVGEQPVEPTRLDPDAEFLGVVDPAWRRDGMVEASVRLGVELVGSVPEEENAVVSPLSLQLALAMLREGASGAAAEQLDALLGLPDGGDSQAVADLRARLARFDGDVSLVDRENPPDEPLVHLADGAFIQHDFPVGEDFLERAAAYHRSQVYGVDFVGGTAKPVLDAWVERETGGLLTEVPEDPPQDTRVVLLNTVTFAGSWQARFDPAGTRDDAFTRVDGSRVEVPMMHGRFTTRLVEGDGWRAVELPYTEGFAMRIVLPDGTGLTAAQWQAVHEALDGAAVGSVDLYMPRWEDDSELALIPMLRRLGLDAIFVPGDLEAVFAGAVVTAVSQGATITVAEKGTVAAAVTQVLIETSRAPTPSLRLVLDHPFEYQVIEQETGLVLFAGRVADPS